jgi:hypothetical protein
MANRIFPTKAQETLGSELVYTGINWDNFGDRLAQVREDEGRGIPDEVKNYLDTLKNDSDNFSDASVTAEADAEVVTAQKELPEALKQHMFKSEADDADAEAEEDEDTKVVNGKEATAGTTRRKVVFSSVNQISAEALEQAKNAGDQELVNTILAARNDRRKALAAKIEDNVREQMERSANIAKRHAYRMSIVSSVEETEKKIAEAAATSASTRTASAPGEGFVKISELKGNSREAFVKKCETSGFPREYVLAMLGEEVDSTELSSDGEKIKTVMSADLSKEIKASAVEGLVKVATLTNSDYDRLRKYWSDELGYGDEEWINDLFSTKYDK